MDEIQRLRHWQRTDRLTRSVDQRDLRHTNDRRVVVVTRTANSNQRKARKVRNATDAARRTAKT